MQIKSLANENAQLKTARTENVEIKTARNSKSKYKQLTNSLNYKNKLIDVLKLRVNKKYKKLNTKKDEIAEYQTET